MVAATKKHLIKSTFQFTLSQSSCVNDKHQEKLSNPLMLHPTQYLFYCASKNIKWLVYNRNKTRMFLMSLTEIQSFLCLCLDWNVSITTATAFANTSHFISVGHALFALMGKKKKINCETTDILTIIHFVPRLGEYFILQSFPDFLLEKFQELKLFQKALHNLL